ncbi:tRNA 2-selenouridine(34) synthase MnmH [Aquibacillus sediminis]|uniref:tRNA 2-selenouridine(34) synthase MnmH n=1 Tax=Aquibacillus sediminis TaxID=2574734 RepID=UPI0011091A99|nr:tRNA 2-selenouridine(34) synthase MnmH [Aquibacillus sediminis]
MFHDVSLEQVLKWRQQQRLTFIDVRSPSEFNHSTIPGSINIPVFTDEERAEVGTIYKQVSQQAAKDRGLEIFSAKLPVFVKQFAAIEQPIITYCWRGGMRSKSAATMVELMGIPVYRLEGGIRSYRQWVVNMLESYQMKQTTYALNGYTGTGKTMILHQLAQQDYPVIDLEGIAAHRGSIFGQIGLEPNNQTTFDYLLLEDLLRLQSSDFILIEAESRRIGKVLLPDFLLEKKQNGIQIFIDIPIEERVLNILEDYQPWKYYQEFLEAFRMIKRRIHTPIAKQIEKDLIAENYTSAFHLLLEYYYDPMYEYSRRQYPEGRSYTIYASNVQEATWKLKTLLETTSAKQMQG